MPKNRQQMIRKKKDDKSELDKSKKQPSKSKKKESPIKRKNKKDKNKNQKAKNKFNKRDEKINKNKKIIRKVVGKNNVSIEELNRKINGIERKFEEELKNNVGKAIIVLLAKELNNTPYNVMPTFFMEKEAIKSNIKYEIEVIKNSVQLESEEGKIKKIKTIIDNAYDRLLCYALSNSYGNIYYDGLKVTNKTIALYLFIKISGGTISSSVTTNQMDKLKELFIDIEKKDDYNTRSKGSIDTKIANHDLEKLKEYIHYLNQSSATSGWDKTTEEINKIIESDFENLFQKIEGRTRTRFGYQVDSVQSQGPHTIARTMGLSIRQFKILNNTTFEKAKKYYAYLTNENTTKKFFKNYQNAAWNKNTSKFNGDDIYYLAHYNIVLDNFKKAKDLNTVVVYGQILSDLHPFATASTIKPSKENLAGGGEGTSRDNLLKSNSLHINDLWTLVEPLIDVDGCDDFITNYFDDFITFLAEGVLCNLDGGFIKSFDGKFNHGKLISTNIDKKKCKKKDTLCFLKTQIASLIAHKYHGKIEMISEYNCKC